MEDVLLLRMHAPLRIHLDRGPGVGSLLDVVPVHLRGQERGRNDGIIPTKVLGMRRLHGQRERHDLPAFNVHLERIASCFERRLRHHGISSQACWELTDTVSPVMYDALSEARNTMTLATSQGSATRP